MEANFTIFLFFFCMWFPFFALSYETYEQSKLPSRVVGPESFAFDCNGEGPYTGVSDGRIFKWESVTRDWIEFAVTARFRRNDLCDGSSDPNLEPICGRPLGLLFNKVTCDLYIADAYFGLMKVGRKGGVARQLAFSAEGVPFRFLNSLDINYYENGVVYFTDSSTKYQRRENMQLVQTGDNTGRFMKYDPRSRNVTVLARDLKFANGVALSKDNKYVLVAETTSQRIIRYWLRGPRAKTTEVFSKLTGSPDNIMRNAKGEFWVGLNNGGASPSKNETIAVRLDKRGQVLETLHGDGLMRGVSEVKEYKGTLFVGSPAMPYVSISRVR